MTQNYCIHIANGTGTDTGMFIPCTCMSYDIRVHINRDDQSCIDVMHRGWSLIPIVDRGRGETKNEVNPAFVSCARLYVIHAHICILVLCVFIPHI